MMRIVCPSCTAAYEVPDTRIVPGQIVRCSRCSVDWTPLIEAAPLAPPPAEPVSAPEEPDLPAPPAEPPPPLVAPPPDRPAVVRRSEPPVLAGWVVSVLLLGGLGWAAVTWRGDVMRMWPPSERAYAALGLAEGR